MQKRPDVIGVRSADGTAPVVDGIEIVAIPIEARRRQRKIGIVVLSRLESKGRGVQPRDRRLALVLDQRREVPTACREPMDLILACNNTLPLSAAGLRVDSVEVIVTDKPEDSVGVKRQTTGTLNVDPQGADHRHLGGRSIDLHQGVHGGRDSVENEVMVEGQTEDVVYCQLPDENGISLQ